MKKAFITGITGQDGSYLAEFLLERGYEVWGLIRRSSSKPSNLWRIQHLLAKIKCIEGDVCDQTSLNKGMEEANPDEVYNFAAQSFVSYSWKSPIYTADVTGLGAVRVLEAIRNRNPKIKFYQASSSEEFGKVDKLPINEESAFHPKSPYAVAKVYAHYATINYRESYNMFAVCGMAFNHESPRRGIEFVTRKISDGVARIYLGIADKLVLGNLDTRRDWGYAPDYVQGMWLMLQQEEPQDYILATNESHSVGEFVEEAFRVAGIDNWQKHVIQDAQFRRPVDLLELRGDYSKARNKLGWEPKVRFKELVQIMVEKDINRLKESKR